MTLPIADKDTNDLLTQELNGLAANGKTQSDSSEIEKQEQPKSLMDQLDVNLSRPQLRPQATPRAQASDKIHSIPAGGSGYIVVVAGDYYAATKEGNELIEYEIPFNLPSLVNTKGEAALSIILRASDTANSLLYRALKKKDSRFKGVHTHYVKSTTPLNGAPEPTSLQYMNLENLSIFAKQRDLGIDPSTYWDVEHLRADMIYLITNQADNEDARTHEKLSNKISDGKGLGVRVAPLEVVRKRHQERIEAKALLDMNVGLGD